MTFNPKKVLLCNVLARQFVNTQDGDPYRRGFGSRNWLAFDRHVMEKAVSHGGSCRSRVS